MFGRITVFDGNRASKARLATGLHAEFSLRLVQMLGTGIDFVCAASKCLHRTGAQAGLAIAAQAQIGAGE